LQPFRVAGCGFEASKRETEVLKKAFTEDSKKIDPVYFFLAIFIYFSPIEKIYKYLGIKPDSDRDWSQRMK
jgi:hypothetical protein